MPLILNLETATEICSVCISQDGKILATVETAEPYVHSSQLTVLIEQCIQKSGITKKGLDAVAVSKGPGSYTSLRVGTSVAKGICYALDIPLLAVDTLQSLALAAAQSGKSNDLYCPMIDARRMEVYTALYQADGTLVEPLKPMIIDRASFQSFFEQEQPLVFIGNGAEKCRTVLNSPFAQFEPIVCSANHLVGLAELAYKAEQFEDVAYFTPIYGKAPNITTPKKRLIVG